MRSIEDILADMQAITDAADAETRALSDEEVTKYGELEAELATVRRTDEIRARQHAYTSPVSTIERVAHAPAAEPEKDLERAFMDYLRTGRANADLAELRIKGDWQTRAQGETTGAAGGYLVPPGFRMKLVERLKMFGGLARAAQEIVTETGQSLQWPTVDDTANSGEVIAEGGTFASGADITFGTKTLGAYRYAAGGGGNTAIKVSVELLQDSAFDLEQYLVRALATRIGRVQAAHFVTGTGTNQPEGIVTPKSAFAAIAATTGTFAPTYGELVQTVHAIDPLYRMGASWLFNDKTLSAIRQIVDGQQRPLWLPQQDSGLGTLPGGTLLGYPVIIDQAMPDLAASGSAKAIAFGDLTESYVIRRVRDIQMVVLNELYANNGQVGFMAWARADGCVQDPNSYAVLGTHA